MSNDQQTFKRARRGGLMACLFAVTAAPVMAQTPGPINPPAQRQEGTIIGGQARTPTFERCVDVQIGNEGAFGCLNQKFRQEVDKVNPSINLPPLDARSSDVRVGNVNEAAVRQQYGSNYGRSVIPLRPPIPSNVLPRR
ncbi:hypothetical protein ACFFWD_07255 [Bradyrhizobium erythrophlei]|uniref:hypothetical protein n=1 Tax=Bradyrhizobium erythrophlei TaxID=1437360 RepID=UPI0035EF323E